MADVTKTFTVQFPGLDNTDAALTVKGFLHRHRKKDRHDKAEEWDTANAVAVGTDRTKWTVTLTGPDAADARAAAAKGRRLTVRVEVRRDPGSGKKRAIRQVVRMWPLV